MHGMLSLAVLVAAFACAAAGGGYVCVRLYRASPAGRPAAGPAPKAPPEQAQ